MPQKSGFFDTSSDDPRYYPAREFAEYFSRFVGNGIYTGGTKLKVDASGSDANVTVSPGFGWINGYLYSVYDAPLVLPIVPATTQDRIDRIVLRLDISAPVRAIRAVVLQGLPAVSPAAPQIVRAGDIYDLSLAQVLVKANTSTIKPENITDERLNNTVCGVVTGVVQQADTTAIFNQFQAWLNTKTAEYSKQWEDFLKSVQDQGFATTQYVDNKVLTGGFGVTTNSGNAYSVTVSPAPTSLVAGLRVMVKINADSTGAPTLNVNGLGAKSVLKASGSAATFKANGVYTLVYSGSAFILQVEGGEYGNATADKVLVGSTFGTESGIQNGTLPNRSAENQHMPSTGSTVWAGDRIFLQPPRGFYDGATWITAPAPDVRPENILAGKKVLEMTGTLQPTVIAPGEGVLISDVNQQYTNSYNYIKMKSFRIGLSGTYRVYFDLQPSGNSKEYVAYGQIYKNGVPYGPEVVSQTGVAYSYFNQDLYFNAGDTCELMLRMTPTAGQQWYVYTTTLSLKIQGMATKV